MLKQKRAVSKLASLQTGPKWDMASRQSGEIRLKKSTAHQGEVLSPWTQIAHEGPWGSHDHHGGGGHTEAPTGPTRWMMPYADLLTLLLGLFLVLYAWSIMPNNPSPQSSPIHRNMVQTRSPLVGRQSTLAKQPVVKTQTTSQVIETKILAQLKNQKGIRVWQESRGTVISLNDSVLFPPAQAIVTPAAKKTLDKFAQTLKALPNPIRVEGHTDNSPIQSGVFPSNWELSTARATNVVRYLITQHGIPANRLAASGYGEFRPIAQNSTIEGKQKNRRVDIVILNALTGAQEPKVETPTSQHNQPNVASQPIVQGQLAGPGVLSVYSDGELETVTERVPRGRAAQRKSVDGPQSPALLESYPGGA
jgi:chemotaxis protein MotB